MTTRDREREVKVSEGQKLVLLEFMEQNDDFAKGKLLTAEKKQTWIALWETLANKLNTMHGARKTTTKWQRAWSDLKNKVKRKSKDIRQQKLKGDLAQLPMKLTEFEKRLMAFVNDDTFYGIKMYNENDKIVMEIDDAVSIDTASPTNDDPSSNQEEDIKLELMDVQNSCIAFPTLNNNEIDLPNEPTTLNTLVKNPKKTKKVVNKPVKKIKPQEYMRKKLEILTDIGKELKKTNELLCQLVVIIKDSNKLC